MARLCRAAAVVTVLVLFLQLQLGGGSGSGSGSGHGGGRHGVRPAARLIHAANHGKKQSLQQSRHAGSKAGWPNPPSSSASTTTTTPANPFGLPMLLPPPLREWPPWFDMPPVQGPSSEPAPAPAPAAVAEHAAAPRRGEEDHPRSIALPPAAAAGGTSRPEVTAVDGDDDEARRHGGGGGGRTNYVVVAAAGASVLLAVSVAAFVLCYRSSKVVTVRPWATGLSGQLQKAFVTGVPALKRAELEAACEDFSNVIGSLPEYAMYKGTLSSGVEIAVVSTTKTSSKEWSKRCETQFRKKITSLSRVNHKNFVNLLGYCEEEQPFTRMMVFEYAPNGTLSEHLHARDDGHLDWATRLRVAVGVAYCLEHMHRLSPPEVVRTLDASTVYLTDDFAAKISDVFFCGDGGEEAAKPAMADRESVVHGYGMLLLEIMAGRFTASEGGLVQGWAASFLRGERRLRDVMDPALGGAFHGETVDRLDAVVRSCTDREPRRRPAMPDVARRLREITAMPPDAATPKVSPLWWAELEIISTEAA
ncbi:probable inactive receptor-like protein kinase At3g56050 [Oryza brachyantha]|uniref:probable inactive receptor-like protein kinase At3g56050 n=1 Tax=Oryza brachyantha TaxID=4533 RepID=UPI001ADC3F05|nr:probable inactive receptor-like protein kinase At3g56050 [Oryza brachyantha]